MSTRKRDSAIRAKGRGRRSTRSISKIRLTSDCFNIFYSARVVHHRVVDSCSGKAMTVDELIHFIGNSTQHKTLYHFTDETNYPSIMENGLLSKEQLRIKGLWPPKAMGGNELSQQLDQIRGIDPYVSLCLTRNHGMKFSAQQAGRLLHPRYLAIKPEVLRIPGARIALGVANANDVEILPVADAIVKLDSEVLYTRTDWNDPDIQLRLRAAEKFEVLIPSRVPRELITGYA
jgi:ssDNA thymidine ADP-ribosyltransferase, DarT